MKGLLRPCHQNEALMLQMELEILLVPLQTLLVVMEMFLVPLGLQ